VKVKFDHIEGFGKVSDLDFIYSAPYGKLEPGESGSQALKEGWIPWGDAWFNLRSVRIDLQQYQPAQTTLRLRKKVSVGKGNFAQNLKQYEALYAAYCQHHGFARNITWEEFGDCEVLEYHTDHLVGISLYKVYDDQFVAMQFIWDYAEPKLSLGNVAQLSECEEALTRGCTHVYLLGGYEHCCRYKAGFKGFEFWTGAEWNQNIDLYYKLVARDEQIQISLA